MAIDIAEWGRPIFWIYPREPSLQPGIGYDGGGYGPDGILTRKQANDEGYGLYDQYGSPGKLDGPERYVDMCRHVHNMISSEAPNITWVMGAIAARFDGAYAQWYPGDDYVDWHAIDVYYPGDSPVALSNKTFAEVVEPVWSEAISINPDKPFMIVELGIMNQLLSENEQNLSGHVFDRSTWFQDFFQAAKTTHKELGAFIYWQDFKHNQKFRAATINKDDPTAGVLYDEMNGSESDWWHSEIFTDTTK